ncbi:MAG: phenylacetate--CoA ligase family protein [Planctomycetaceae bacterium]
MQDEHPERLSVDGLRQRQSDRLVELLRAVSRSNPFWQRKYTAAGVDLRGIRSVDDITRLPFCTKQELVDDQNVRPPFGTNLTFARAKYHRLHQTSGTTGRPMRWLDTPESWDWMMSCWGQMFRIAGLHDDDVLAFPFSFGPFIGFWAGFDGACRQGNLCVAMGGMSSEARLKLIHELGCTWMCCTPTYALRLVEVAAEMRMDLSRSPIRAILVAGEPGGNIRAIRERLHNAWGARVVDHWGMTDIGALGIEPKNAPGGLTILETECIAEIVNPETGEAVPRGEMGELIITNLGRIGQPVIRYRTGDLVRASKEPCPSGLSLLRLEGGILGRADDMVTIRGNNVFPSSVEAILREFEDITEYRIIVQTKREMPHLKVEIEPSPGCAQSDIILQSLLGAVNRQIKDRLNFQAEIVPVPVESLPRFEMKGRRFVRET